jgi:hypothetical protein
MKRASHPPFSLDRAPSDFYLFGKLKNALIRAEFADEKSLFDAVIGCSRESQWVSLKLISPNGW